MKSDKPKYDNFEPNPTHQKSNSKRYGIKVARTINDLMQVFAIRSAVFISEQNCPYDEEFDGNDLCGIHLLGFSDTEPVACLRIRFFADFAKFERLAVRHEFRQTRVSFEIVKAGIELVRKKGYKTIYGQAQDRLVNFWSRFGFKPLEKRCDLVFSDFSYTEILNEVDPHPEPISPQSDPYLIIRPEGTWHQLGVLDESAKRPATSPLRNLSVA